MDRYCKGVLTVIAVALTWICVRDALPIREASAQTLKPAERVVLVGIEFVDSNGASTSHNLLPISIENLAVKSNPKSVGPHALPVVQVK